jgi:hypothetical protein
VTTGHVVGALDQQGAEVDISSLGDAKLRVSSTGLTSSWSQSQVATHIAALPEPFFAPQGENIDQRNELAYTINLDQCLCLSVLGFC